MGNKTKGIHFFFLVEHQLRNALCNGACVFCCSSLYAFQDYGGINNKFFTPLPKRNWAQCFDDKINVTTDHLDLVESEVEDYYYDEEGDILDDEEEESLDDDEDGEEELI